jgi:hypothetical protein
VLAEWETRRPYLATVCRECQLWKSAPDAAFESSLHSGCTVGQKKGHSPRQGRRKVALRPKNRYILNCFDGSVFGLGIGAVARSLVTNCSASVEPASAVVEEFPLAIT